MITCVKIKEVLKRHDVEGLIAGGAPADEYDSEAEEIYAALQLPENLPVNEDAVFDIVCRVWNKSFGHAPEETSRIAPVFRTIASDILAQKKT